MPGAWTDTSPQGGDVVDCDRINKDISTILSGIQSLGNNELPSEALGVTDFVTPVYDGSAANNYSIGTNMLSANTYKARAGDNTPALSISPEVDTYVGGWKKLYDLYAGSPFGCRLELPDFSGTILHGRAMVNFSRRVSYSENLGVYLLTGSDQWVQFAVSVDGTIVAETGLIFACRTTVVFPFHKFVSPGEHDIELLANWSMKYQAPAAGTLTYPTGGIDNDDAERYPNINFYTHSIACDLEL